MSSSASGTSFRLCSETPIESLRINVRHFEHASGAVHYHLASEDPHRSFLVGFRTIPKDNSGLPHILEHCALCGSDRFPVRDPFFMMLRRSLQTFMNAMTGSDLTVYLFSTQVPKDFENLLSIYLDASFRPILDSHDFAQEGHRLEPKGDDLGPNVSGWERKGVVYNEMKGAMNSTSRQVYQAIGRGLLPDTEYRFNSGGDPLAIPELTHKNLVEFHRRSYCPANACLVTYGDLDENFLHQQFEPYLSRSPGNPIPPPSPQPPLQSPKTVDVDVPLESGQDVLDVTSVSLGWLLEEIDIDSLLLGALLDELLVGNPAAPVRLELEKSGLGRSLGIAGYLGSMRNGLFFLEMRGVPTSDYGRFETLAIGALESVVKEGLSREEIDGALHQLELARRVIGGGSVPFGLQLCDRVIDAWKLNQTPLETLDPASALDRLREKAHRPGFLTDTIRTRFLDNPSRLLVRAKPDDEFAKKLAQAEQVQIAEELKSLDDVARKNLKDQADELNRRQNQPADGSCLPELLLEDVPKERAWVDSLKDTTHPKVRRFEQGTNGILHHVAAIPLKTFTKEELLILPVISRCLGRLGVGSRTYTEQAQLLNRTCGGLSSSFVLNAADSSDEKLSGYFKLETVGLQSRYADFVPYLAEIMRAQRFDETARFGELVSESLASLQAGVLNRGSVMASYAAARGFPGRAGLSHQLSGLGYLASLRKLHEALGSKASDIRDRCQAFLQKLSSQPIWLAIVGDGVSDDSISETCLSAWDGFDIREDLPEPKPLDVSIQAVPETPSIAYTTGTSVHYTAIALPGVPLDHEDAPVLAVAGRYLTNGFLHTAIREKGGAYGASASANSSTATFSVSTYRDPRIMESLDDIARGFEWLKTIGDDERPLREAILSVLAGIDAPGSPAGEATSRFMHDLLGRSPEVLNRYRSRVTQVSAEAIRRVAHERLHLENASRAVITNVESARTLPDDWAREAL